MMWAQFGPIFPFWENRDFIYFRIFGPGIYSKINKFNLMLTFFAFGGGKGKDGKGKGKSKGNAPLVPEGWAAGRSKADC